MSESEHATWQEIEEKAFAQQRVLTPISDALCAVAAHSLVQMQEGSIIDAEASE